MPNGHFSGGLNTTLISTLTCNFATGKLRHDMTTERSTTFNKKVQSNCLLHTLPTKVAQKIKTAISASPGTVHQ